MTLIQALGCSWQGFSFDLNELCLVANPRHLFSIEFHVRAVSYAGLDAALCDFTGLAAC